MRIGGYALHKEIAVIVIEVLLRFIELIIVTRKQ